MNSQSKISMMTRGALLINVSRGGPLDDDTLVEALVFGDLGEVALDVYASEPYSGSLAELPQVIRTAHMSSYSLLDMKQMETESVQNLVAGLYELKLLEKP